ncbi:MAG TPA: hypothetical protein VNF50_04685 [Acidimicrobiales bacterium]|nr:hypothetical protein [Acidimicrobiales bacterium]
MTTAKRGLGEMTLGDIGKGVMRYRPFLLAVATIVLVVVFLPGKPSSTSLSSSAPGASTGAATGVASPGGASSAASGSTGSSGAGSALAGSSGSASGGTGGSGSVAAAGGGSSGSSGGSTGSAGGGGGGALTPAPAVATTDPHCDQATGHEAIPSVYSPPCVPSWTPSMGNGGGTYSGVSGSTITIAVPLAQNQGEAAALRAASNNPDTQAQIEQGNSQFVDLFEHHYQTYGRKVQLQYYTSSYNSGDSLAAQNAECQSDANKVAKQMMAFASWTDCGTNAYENTLSADGVLCFCTVTVAASYYLQWAPYVWGTGLPDETAAYNMRAEVICSNLVPYAPKYAGSANLNAPVAKKRVFGLIWPGASSLDDTDIYRSGADYFASKLKACGADLAEDVSFPIVDPTGPADAQTLMAKFQSDGVTTVILVSDPLDPIFLTGAATKQGYLPEWFDSGSALIDTTHYGRLYDQSQWAHSFGISFLADRVEPTSSDAYNFYHWQFGTTPPDPDDFTVNYPFFEWLFAGIQMAGPDLTPYHLQCGMPPYTSVTRSGPLGSSKGVACVGKVYPGLFGYVGPLNYQNRVTNALIAYGSKIWPWDYYNQINDGVLIWWNPNASGLDETNNSGKGMQEYMDNGKRYLWGQFPTGQQPWFATAGAVDIFTTLPPADQPPSFAYSCYYLCNSPGY